MFLNVSRFSRTLQNISFIYNVPEFSNNPYTFAPERLFHADFFHVEVLIKLIAYIEESPLAQLT